MKNTTKPKVCPLCGKAPVIVNNGLTPFIGCSFCVLYTQCMPKDGKETCIRAWNKLVERKYLNNK